MKRERKLPCGCSQDRYGAWTVCNKHLEAEVAEAVRIENRLNLEKAAR